MLRLIGTDGTRYYAWDLVPGNYTIGRNPDVACQITDKTVSRKHAEIEVVEGSEIAFLTDLESHNGTAVNGNRVTGRIEIKAGDTISFGQADFRITGDKDASSSINKPPTAQLAINEPEKSVFLDIREALKPLPQKVTDLPGLLPALSELARVPVLTEPKETMLERTLQLVAKVIPAERLAVLFTSEDQKEIYTAASVLPQGKDPGSFRLSRTIINDILTEKNAILIGNPMDDPRFAAQQSIILSDMKSAMAVPLFDAGRVLGILYADTTNPMHRYNDDYLRLMAVFGNIIASRLVNYELLLERQEKQLLDAEIRRASQIQKNLLVKDSPALEGYEIFAFQEQCRVVGGDLYDVASLPDGRMLLMVGDVSGKGMGAALLMSNILASFRILYNDPQFDLAKAVVQVSRQLCSYSAPNDFATLFIAILDPRDNTLRFVNAGHNPPVLMHPDGSRETLEPSGCMIGAFDFIVWEEQTVSVKPGDLIYVYTDGVTEAENGTEQFGEPRMYDFLAQNRHSTARELAGAMMKRLETFIADTPRSDDITMLVVKRG